MGGKLYKSCQDLSEVASRRSINKDSIALLLVGRMPCLSFGPWLFKVRWWSSSLCFKVHMSRWCNALKGYAHDKTPEDRDMGLLSDTYSSGLGCESSGCKRLREEAAEIVTLKLIV